MVQALRYIRAALSTAAVSTTSIADGILSSKWQISRETDSIPIDAKRP